MSENRPVLELGDLVWVDFDPALGTEQRGFRPAMVVSNGRFNARSRRSLVCPITMNPAPYPTKVPLPEGLAVRGAVLVDQVRSVDHSLRGFHCVGRAPPETVGAVHGLLLSFLLEPGTRIAPP